jgi:dTDP-4-amino-4,6-dideoxygalactose transaminase
MIKEKVSLIPRNNWDYGLTELVRALTGVFKPVLDYSESFERVFGLKPVLTTSGRTSLYAILKSLNLPEGSGVAVPLFCCSVVFDAIRKADLVPKFIDVNLDDYNLSSTDLAKKKAPISAVIVVHMFGHPADMDSISDVSGGVPVIEDCAQSLFSKYKDVYTGLLSTASFFSFRSGKYLSVGEGSAIFCREPLINKYITNLVETFDNWNFYKMIKHCFATYIKSSLYKRPLYGTIGYPIGKRVDRKFNLTAKTGFTLSKIAASDLRIINDRIERFSEKIQKQRENAIYLLKNIKLQNVYLPYEKKECFTNYFQFAIRFENTEQRDSMAEYLFECGIDTAKYLDEIIGVAREYFRYSGDCPNAEQCSKTVLLVPIYYTLSVKDLDYIVDCLNKGARYL